MVSAVGTELLLATGLVLSVFGLLATFQLITGARRRCQLERERTEAEIEAYTAFARRVGEVDTGMVAQATTGPTANVVDANLGDDMRAVEAAYQETVMATPHFEEEYGDPLYASLEADFGRDTAKAIEHNRALSPQLKATIVAGCRQAVGERMQFLRAVDDELDDLHRLNGDLTALESDRQHVDAHIDGAHAFDLDPATSWDSLDGIERGCDDLAAARQRSIRRASRFGMDDLSLHEYLYGSVSGPTYPVLAEVVELVSRVKTTRNALVARIV